MNAYAIPRVAVCDAGRFYDIYDTVVPSGGHYSPTRFDYFDEFYGHLRRWERATGAMSSLTAMFRHESFRAIVNLGEECIPLILYEIRGEPSFLALALNEITAEQPYPESLNGNIKAICGAWVAWGQRSGYVLS